MLCGEGYCSFPLYMGWESMAWICVAVDRRMWQAAVNMIIGCLVGRSVGRSVGQLVLLNVMPCTWMDSSLLLLLVLLLYDMDVSCHRPFLPGTSLEPAVIPTAQTSSFTLQYFPYYV